MLSNLLLGAFMDQYGIFLVLGGFFVLMMVMTILPQKKRQKQMQEMMSNLVVGNKVMTIGRMIGTIELIDSENNQVVLNVGSEQNPTLVTFDRQAIAYVITKKDVPTDDTKSDAPADDSSNDVKID